jgi:hypothetical protein
LKGKGAPAGKNKWRRCHGNIKRRRVPRKDKWRRCRGKTNGEGGTLRRCRNVERKDAMGSCKEKGAVESFKEKVPWEDKKNGPEEH